jgi:hypothetical protein
MNNYMLSPCYSARWLGSVRLRTVVVKPGAGDLQCGGAVVPCTSCGCYESCGRYEIGGALHCLPPRCHCRLLLKVGRRSRPCIMSLLRTWRPPPAALWGGGGHSAHQPHWRSGCVSYGCGHCWVLSFCKGGLSSACEVSHPEHGTGAYCHVTHFFICRHLRSLQ